MDGPLRQVLVAIGRGGPSPVQAGQGADEAEAWGEAHSAELLQLRAAVAEAGRDQLGDLTFLPSPPLPSDDPNLFAGLIARAHASTGAGGGSVVLAELFAGLSPIGTLAGGGRLWLERYAIGASSDGDDDDAQALARQVLHHDDEARLLAGVVADGLASQLYLASLYAARAADQLSPAGFADGLGLLAHKVAPTWAFPIDEFDPEFTRYGSRRPTTMIWYRRARWLQHVLGGAADQATLERARELFDPASNTRLDAEAVEARVAGMHQAVPTALYAMWRAYLWDEPELDRYLAQARTAPARLTRDAGALIDELRRGVRTRLGAITDVPAWVRRVRALGLDPRHASGREAGGGGTTTAAVSAARAGAVLVAPGITPGVAPVDAAAAAQATRRAGIEREVAATPRRGLADVGWRTIGDGTYHRVLLTRLAGDDEVRAQLRALDHLPALTGPARAVALRELAVSLDPALEAVLAGALVRADPLDDVLERDADEQVDLVGGGAAADGAGEPAGASAGSELELALGWLRQAQVLAPVDAEVPLALAAMLRRHDRLDDLLGLIAEAVAPAAAQVVVSLGEDDHPRFADALAVLLARPAARAGSDVPASAWAELVRHAVRLAPERLADLAARLPDDVDLLAEVAFRLIRAERREDAITVYDRLLGLPLPPAGTHTRRNYLGSINNACIQAYSAGDVALAARIADHAQPYARENPYIYHSAACAYAGVGDLRRAMTQVRLAIEHDYEHLARLEVDPDLGELRHWPEFRAAFAPWHLERDRAAATPVTAPPARAVDGAPVEVAVAVESPPAAAPEPAPAPEPDRDAASDDPGGEVATTEFVRVVAATPADAEAASFELAPTPGDAEAAHVEPMPEPMP
ncbi:MAG: hypothetical protein KBG28_06455, partial [Kofleriaceae bacterium]|nr:hypothetical protein [Kofleriaceae bacterium]